MNTDASTSIQSFSALDAKTARETAQSLALQNRDLDQKLTKSEAEVGELRSWVRDNAPSILNRGGRVVASAFFGAATGVAFGTFDHTYALLGAGVSATAAGFGTLLFKRADFKDLMTCISGGIVAGAAAIESARATQTAWKERAAKKAAGAAGKVA